MNASPAYAFAPRALRRWRDERLTLADATGGGLCATFQFEGSTCGNMPFNLLYQVRLASAQEEYRLLELSCAPAAGDEGHERMCSYLESAERILSVLQSERPLLGQPLADVLSWKPTTSPAGCVCASSARNHKWLAVLQTLHFALIERSPAPSIFP